MKLIIDISEDDYRKVQDGRGSVSMMRKVIRNGTPLPKGHGRLIDADAFSGDMFCDADMTNQHTCYYSIRKLLDSAHTIIEADNESEG